MTAGHFLAWLSSSAQRTSLRSVDLSARFARSADPLSSSVDSSLCDARARGHSTLPFGAKLRMNLQVARSFHVGGGGTGALRTSALGSSCSNTAIASDLPCSV